MGERDTGEGDFGERGADHRCATVPAPRSLFATSNAAFTSKLPKNDRNL